MIAVGRLTVSDTSVTSAPPTVDPITGTSDSTVTSAPSITAYGMPQASDQTAVPNPNRIAIATVDSMNRPTITVSSSRMRAVRTCLDAGNALSASWRRCGSSMAKYSDRNATTTMSVTAVNSSAPPVRT